MRTPTLSRPTAPRSRVLAVLLVALVLIGGANLAAYAANGKPLLLGKTNTETRKAVVKNTGSGPALHLKTQPDQPPLKVNRTKKVNKLNADLVDGHSAADLESVTYRYQVPGTTAAFQHIVDFPGLPPGLYLMAYTIVSEDGGDPLCIVQPSNRGLSYNASSGPYDTNNATLVVDTTSTPAALRCSGSAGLKFYGLPGDAVSEVSFTRLDAVTESTPTVSRPGSRGPRGGPAPGN